MGEIYEEMKLDEGSTYVPKTIAQVFTDVSMVDDLAKKASMLGFHIHELEKEISKIEYYKRELPRSMHILEDATETLKKEMLRWKGQKKEPAMVDFLQSKGNLEGCGGVNGSFDISEKKRWMRSVHLWSTPVHYEEDNFDTRNQDSVFRQESSHKGEEGNSGEKLFEGYARKNRGGAFLPYNKPRNNGREAADSVDGMGTSIDINVIVGDQQLQKKKRRRCWSPELHKRFVDALHQLGGEHAATPKQIKELMKVHGLTNDQVKSHLQASCSKAFHFICGATGCRLLVDPRSVRRFIEPNDGRTFGIPTRPSAALRIGFKEGDLLRLIILGVLILMI